MKFWILNERKVLGKTLRDLSYLAVLAVFCVVLDAYMGYLDPTATTDGMGNLYVAMQTLCIGFACAFLSAGIRWYYFKPPRWSSIQEKTTNGATWPQVALITLDRLTWLVPFLFFFYFATGH